MKKLYDFIKAKILADLPEFKTVRVWREQYMRSNEDRDENAFPYPACFIEFVTTDYFNYALGYRDVNLIIRFHFGFESYWLEKDLDWELTDKFDKVMFRFRGNEDDPVHFVSMQKISQFQEANDNNVDLQVIEYITMFRELSSYEEGLELAPVDLDLDGGFEGEFIEGGLQDELQSEIVG